jgi:hypothetical protein
MLGFMRCFAQPSYSTAYFADRRTVNLQEPPALGKPKMIRARVQTGLGKEEVAARALGSTTA